MSNRIFSISLHLQDEKGNFRDAPSVRLIAVRLSNWDSRDGVALAIVFRAHNLLEEQGMLEIIYLSLAMHQELRWTSGECPQKEGEISNTLPHAERVRGLGSRWSMGGWWCTIWQGIRCAGREGGQVFGAGRFLFGRGGQRVYLDGMVMWELDWCWRYR
jgi:hypothetical protein